MPCAHAAKRILGGMPSPAIPSGAAFLLEQMVNRLRLLERLDCPSPLDTRFRSLFREITGLAGRYQEVVISHSEYTLSCAKGCASCCFHWVEDVNSFEAEIIADRIRSVMPDRIEAVRKQCCDDLRELERLEGFVDTRLRGATGTGGEEIDPVDLLLGVFYRMRRPCPLLDGEGNCMVYDIRPLTCRIYVSFSDPVRCDPEYVRSEMIRTCIIDFSEEVNRILDTLHFRYMRFPDDTGLRSQLEKYLA